jgi:hypothetical protein
MSYPPVSSLADPRMQGEPAGTSIGIAEHEICGNHPQSRVPRTPRPASVLKFSNVRSNFADCTPVLSLVNNVSQGALRLAKGAADIGSSGETEVLCTIERSVYSCAVLAFIMKTDTQSGF